MKSHLTQPILDENIRATYKCIHVDVCIHMYMYMYIHNTHNNAHIHVYNIIYIIYKMHI